MRHNRHCSLLESDGSITGYRIQCLQSCCPYWEGSNHPLCSNVSDYLELQGLKLPRSCSSRFYWYRCIELANFQAMQDNEQDYGEGEELPVGASLQLVLSYCVHHCYTDTVRVRYIKCSAWRYVVLLLWLSLWPMPWQVLLRAYQSCRVLNKQACCFCFSALLKHPGERSQTLLKKLSWKL